MEIGNSFPLGIFLEGNECTNGVETQRREFGDARSVGSLEDVGIEESNSRDSRHSRHSWISKIFRIAGCK